MKKYKIMIIISLILFIIAGYLYSITENKNDSKTNIIIKESKVNFPAIEENIFSDTKTTIDEVEEKSNDTSASKTNVEEKKVESKKNITKKNNSTKKTTSKKVKETKNNNNNTLESGKPGIITKSEDKEGKKEEVQTKTNEETAKTIEIVIEEPKNNNYENDPVYQKMKKELFPTLKECNRVGKEINLKDMENISSTMCTSESYKEIEVGFRLFIRYNDGTYKEYKK